MATPSAIAVLLRQPAVSASARILLCLPYWWSGLAKLANLPGAMAEARSLGLNPAWLVVAATVAVQLVGSALVIGNWAAWLGAGALAVFTAIATLIAHAFWTLPDPVERFHAFNTFLEHLGLIGGFISVAALLEHGRAQGRSP